MNKKAFMFLCFFISLSLLSTWMDKTERRLYGVKPGVTLEGQPVQGLLEGELSTVVQELSLKHERMAIEPTLNRETGAVVPGREGCLVNIQESLKRCLAASPNQEVSLVRIPVLPRHRALELEQCRTVLGSFQTPIYGSYHRYQNISLASTGLNNAFIWPQDVLSFNEIVGPRTAERGFMPAPIIIMDDLALDYGGGVCQLATTLYNAALQSGLAIVERHEHTRLVPYVPKGRDAAVDYGSLDLKLRNTTSGPIIIKAAIDQGMVRVLIMGKGKTP